MYFSYVLADVGYNLILGWAARVDRIHAEERILSRDPGWPDDAAAGRPRLLPGLW